MRYPKIAVLLFLLLPFSANANDSYFEIDYMSFTLDGDPWFDGILLPPGLSYEAEPTGLGLKAGKKVTPNFAVEGMFVFGLADDDVDAFPGFDIEISNILAVYGVGNFPVSPTFDLFAKAGIAIVSYEDIDGDEIDGTGLSFGFGGAFNVGPGAIVVEYVIYPETEYDESLWGGEFTVDSSSLNIGYRSNF